MADFDARVATLSPEKRALLDDALRRRRQAKAADTIPRRTELGPAPLSFSQQRIWFLEQWNPGTPTNHGVRVFRLRGRLDVDALRSAFQGVVERHEILRTVYRVVDGEPRQLPLERWSVDVPVVDLTHLPDSDREAELRSRLRDLAREPYDLENDVVLRTGLFRLGEDDAVLLVGLHHIAYDAWSDRVFLSEVSALYAGGSDLPELPIQYADFAVWQRDTLSGPELTKLVDYWRRTLDGVPQQLHLPTDRPRPAVQRHEGSHHSFTLGHEARDGVAELARAEGVTPYMAFLALFATLLYRVTGESDVVVGSPIAARTKVELERLVGFFSNTLVLRNRLGGNPSFRELLRRTRELATSAYAHQELPFERIVEELKIPRDPGYNPLFQVNFRAQAAEETPLQLPGIEAEPLSLDIGFSRFDLALELRTNADRIEGYFEYDHDLFELETIRVLADDLAAVLEQVLADPDRPILALKIATSGRQAARSKAIPRIRTR